MSFHEEMARRQKRALAKGIYIMDDEKQSITSPRI